MIATSGSAGASAGSPTNTVETSRRKMPHVCKRVRTGSTRNPPSSIMGNASTPKFIKTIKTPCKWMSGGNGAPARRKAQGCKLTLLRRKDRGAWLCLDGRLVWVGCAAERRARLHNPDKDRQARDHMSAHLQPARGAHLNCSAVQYPTVHITSTTNCAGATRGPLIPTAPVELRVHERLARREDKEREKRHCVGHVEVRLR